MVTVALLTVCLSYAASGIMIIVVVVVEVVVVVVAAVVVVGSSSSSSRWKLLGSRQRASTQRGFLSLPKIRRQCAFQAFSVPRAGKLQRLLSVGPQGYMFSKNCSKSNDDP